MYGPVSAHIREVSMSRTTAIAALAALLLSAGARAQEPKKDAPVDPKVEALIRQAVEKAKQEMREEVRHDLQSAQATAEFSGATAPGPKLQFLELNGSFRVRGDLKDSYDLHRPADNADGHLTAGFGGTTIGGNYVYPGPVLPGNLAGAANPRSSMPSANMRLRLEPTLNVSERVRVRMQADLFDNYVLGSRPLDQYGLTGCGAGVTTCTFASHGGATTSGAVLTDRPVINLKLAWGEVETPLGLLSFGRMPSVWGLGIVAPAQDGLDDDFGNIADRLQFATMPVATIIGNITFIPYLDFFANGPLQGDPRWSKTTLLGVGSGQPFSPDSSGSGRVLGLKVLKLDTVDELRRKLERGEASFNYGLFYEYTTLATVFSGATDQFPLDTGTGAPPVTSDAAVRRGEYDHQADLWLRFRTSRLHVELEGTYLYGHVNNPTMDPGYGTADTTRPLDGLEVPILLRQFGAALRTSYQVAPNKVTLGLELGIASGDRAPGFGNRPWLANTDQTKAPSYAVVEGTQFNLKTGDHDIRNFRFNPGYRPDLIFWRDIMGQVTDAWYAKPSLHVDIVSGLAWDFATIFSQSLYKSSTPSTNPDTGAGGSTLLGLEADTKLSLSSDEGFSAWGAAGVFQPLAAFDGAGSTSRAWTLKFGLAARF
jgi:uncharacterized protein (TIGR04551 family)